ncbi:hypothetical protein FHR47_001723 [Xanthomonas arboricola]|uniref:hypothetical protein n=1 Tax=Xanthomonas cannabis TaxID=1885674 RepID=UPI00161D7A37|nr:hypothetical protein [Xanthomonas cannabis]MBB3801475.1 hypothetical protein [Xanthomonas cannabis]
MKKLPDWLSHRGFWMALATLALWSTAIGIVIGSWIASTKETGAAIGSVISSFLGAAIAVTGAVWIQEVRDARMKKQVLLTVSQMVPALRAIASDLSDFHIIHKMDDRVIRQAVDSLKARREQLIRLGPLHGALDSDLQMLLFDIEIRIGTFEVPTETSKKQVPNSFGSGILKINIVSKSEVIAKAIGLLYLCDQCLTIFNIPKTEMTSSQRTEMRRIYGNT